MRSDGGAHEVMRVVYIGNPVAIRFVDRVFEGLAATFNTNELGTKHADPERIERLTTHILGSHINDAL